MGGDSIVNMVDSKGRTTVDEDTEGRVACAYDRELCGQACARRNVRWANVPLQS
jgi:hypothetical protein